VKNLEFAAARRAALPPQAIPEAAAPSAAPSDAALVRRCLSGNDEAWKALLEKYKRLIYSIPVKYGLSPDQASDVFQEVCVELLAELPRLREPRALPKWLMQVASHKCARLRSRELRAPIESADADGSPAARIADTSRLTDDVLFDVQREQALRDAVAALPPRCRRLIQMLFFETPARPYRDIAADLNLACGSIGFIRGRCLQRLRTELRRNGFR